MLLEMAGWMRRLRRALRGLALPLAILLSVAVGAGAGGGATPAKADEAVARAPSTAGLTAPWDALDEGQGKHALLSDRVSGTAGVSSRRKTLKTAAPDRAPSLALAPSEPPLATRPRHSARPGRLATPPRGGRQIRPYLPQGPPSA